MFVKCMAGRLCWMLALAGGAVLFGGCASSATPEETAPVDSLASSAPSEVQPDAVVQYQGCSTRGYGFKFWYYGGSYGAAPSAAECTSWCTGTCGRSGGRFNPAAYNPGYPATATCYCNR
jgi:hypothetical protein